MSTLEKVIFEKVIENEKRILILETEIKNLKNKIPANQEKANQKIIECQKSKVGTSGKGNISIFHHFQFYTGQVDSFNKEISKRQNEINTLKIFNAQQLDSVDKVDFEKNTPTIVAISSLLPLGIIGLFLYSRTARK